MFATATHYIDTINTTCIVPAIEWSLNHKILMSTIGASILVGVVLYESPKALDLMKRNIKLMTVVIPIAYTIPAPIVGFCMALTPNVSYDSGKMYEAYCQSIVKVWQEWFKFAGISM